MTGPWITLSWDLRPFNSSPLSSSLSDRQTLAELAQGIGGFHFTVCSRERSRLKPEGEKENYRGRACVEGERVSVKETSRQISGSLSNHAGMLAKPYSVAQNSLHLSHAPVLPHPSFHPLFPPLLICSCTPLLPLTPFLEGSDGRGERGEWTPLACCIRRWTGPVSQDAGSCVDVFNKACALIQPFSFF